VKLAIFRNANMVMPKVVTSSVPKSLCIGAPGPRRSYFPLINRKFFKPILFINIRKVEYFVLVRLRKAGELFGEKVGKGPKICHLSRSRQNESTLLFTRHSLWRIGNMGSHSLRHSFFVELRRAAFNCSFNNCSGHNSLPPSLG